MVIAKAMDKVINMVIDKYKPWYVPRFIAKAWVKAKVKKAIAGAMAWLHRWVDRTLQAICVLLMLGLAVIVIAAVAFRLAGSSLVWYDELAAVWLAWLSLFGAALAAGRRAHLGLDALLRAVRPPPLQWALFVLGEVCVVAFFALMAFYGYKALAFIAGQSLVSLPWLDNSVVQAAVPVAAVLFILAQVSSWPRALAGLRGGGA